MTNGRAPAGLHSAPLNQTRQMNKSELVKSLADATEQSQAAATRSLDALIGIVSEELAKGGEVVIPGFGTFKTAERAERSGRNPQTGEAITIAAATAVKFVPGASLKAAVNTKGS
ncbi:MAG TPA: HU family DNA-binding protein [Ramlibacter sp.]|uniref:HU family DNA-binding protein n=1 Tax=Ramlibacter sp. TaxID=1917967 RepID=UPI002D7EDABF|nr:HU family DNA-binding protein [Ramlibacter sp.]HET8748647.1 HU family DNA-binding protein [Ramlibacter sp.]